MIYAHRAAIAALVAAAALTLQGCGGGNCDKIVFQGGSVAAGTRDQAGKVTCESGDYSGPELTCNWVGVKCLKPGDDGKRTCGIDYSFGEKGTGFDEWPQNKDPETVDSKNQLPETQFQTTGVVAQFAAKATEAAGETLSKKLAKAAAKAKAKAAEAAAAAKKKGGELADKAKKKGAELAAKAKGDDGKDEGKDDGKDDAKAEEKRRLADATGGEIDGSKLKCSASKAKGGGKDDAKGDAKDDAKGDGKDDAKGDAKAEKLFSMGPRTSQSVATTSGWMMPLVGVVALVGLAFVALKFSRRSSQARNRELGGASYDEESSNEAIE